jgi:NitT/TauT family transport system substrate-binding protein
MDRRGFIGGLAAVAGFGMAGATYAEAPERRRLTIAHGAFTTDILPLVLADQLGLFSAQGLDISLTDASKDGGPGAALLGGNAQAAIIGYDETIRQQARGHDLMGVALLNPVPGLVLGVRDDLAGRVRDMGAGHGMRVGIAVPGLCGEIMLKHLLRSQGMTEADIVRVPTGTVPLCLSALERRDVDLLLHRDPAATILERKGVVRPLYDTRTDEGARNAYGGDYPSRVIALSRRFADTYPVTTQRLVNGLIAGMIFLHAHTSEEIADTLPARYLLGDRALFTEVLDHARDSFSAGGRFEPEALVQPRRLLGEFDPDVRRADVDIARTYTNRFVDAAPNAG